jgi:hypothetical protein
MLRTKAGRGGSDIAIFSRRTPEGENRIPLCDQHPIPDD